MHLRLPESRLSPRTVALRKRIAQLEAENLALRAENADLRSENAALREKLEENSHNSSRPPSADATSRPRHPKRNRTGRKPGGQRGHTGRRRALVEKPDRLHAVDAHRCELCGGHNMERTGETPRRHQVVEIPAAPREVSEWQMHQAQCLDCQHRVWPSLPPNVPTGGFGPRLQATIAYMTGTLRLSRRMTEHALSDLFGVPISLGSVSATEKAVSAVVAGPVKQAHAAACAQPVAHIDETGWRHHGGKAWLWVLCTTAATVFKIAADRGHQTFRTLTRGFDGILVSDRWVVYDQWDLLKRQLCWAHLERTWQKFIERGGPSAKIGRALLDETQTMFRWWRKVRDGTMTREHFRQHMQPVIARVQDLLEKGGRLRAHAKTRRTCTRIRLLAPALWTFIDVEGVEPTNNAGEQRIRAGVQWRATSLGTQSPAGAEYVERMLTVTATLRQHGRNVYEYLVHAMQDRLHNRPAPSLLSDAHVGETDKEAT